MLGIYCGLGFKMLLLLLAFLVAPQRPEILLATTTSTRDRLVMHNDFLIVGPPADPAGLRGMNDARAAVRRTLSHQAPFVSRGDRSGTHLLEQRLWRLAGVRLPPHGEWYVESGQGMAATLQMADQKRAYTITDRATYLAWRDKVHLVPVAEPVRARRSAYGSHPPVNPARWSPRTMCGLRLITRHTSCVR
jgi:tungstate transport system substrate-binding protein